MKSTKFPRRLTWLPIILLGAFLTACQDDDRGRDPVFEGDGALAAQKPQVTAVAPVKGSTGVPLNLKVIAAEFSEPMAPFSSSSDFSFTLTCEAPCTDPTGEAALNSDGTIGIYTLADGTSLEASTVYTGRVSGALSLSSGLEMLGPFVWEFTTGTTNDTTRPRVASTKPETSDPGPTTGVPANAAVSAVFSESLDPSTVGDVSFTLTCADPCVSPEGAVSYSLASRTAVFKPDTVLDFDTTYMVTLSTELTDLVGNALAGDDAFPLEARKYTWEFTTASAISASELSVLSVLPQDGAIDVCPDASVNATFDVPSGLRMDPNTVDSVSFLVTGPAPDETPVLSASVSLDSDTGTIATFIPLNDLTPGDAYTAVVLGLDEGVKDLANPANVMGSDFTWTFTVGPAEDECLQAVALNTAAPFGTFGGSAGMTNTGIQTQIHGDIGTTSTSTSTVTGFHDENGDVYTETTANIGAVNGLIYTCTTSTTGPTSDEVNAVSCQIAEDARLDAEVAYLELAGLPGGPDPGAGNLANLTLSPGVYTSSSGTFKIEGGDLTLDAQGDGNAVWVFQMATTLTVGGPGADFPQSIIMVNGAQPKNVFWQVGSAATINAAGGGTMVGTIITKEGVAISTVGNTDIVTLDGRAISLGGSVTMVDTIINVPAQ